jgi:hypothetical protein
VITELIMRPENGVRMSITPRAMKSDIKWIVDSAVASFAGQVFGYVSFINCDFT